MSLDKETIALLDEKQLKEIIGGQGGGTTCPATNATSCSCCTGTTVCNFIPDRM